MTPRTAAEVIAAKRPLRRRVRVVLAPELAEDLEEARAALAAAERDGDEETVARARQAVVDAEQALEDQTVELVLRALGRRQYEDLVAAHPPTDLQLRKAAADGGTARFNLKTFLPALLAATVEAPAMTVEEAEELAETWSAGEVAALYAVAVEVNNAVGAVGNGRP